MAIYSRYRVIASRCKMTVVNNNISTNNNINAVLFATTQTTAVTIGDDAEEQPDGMEDTAGLATGPAEDNMVQYMKTATVLNVPNISYSTEYSGTSTANPATQWYWRTHIAPTDGVTALNVYLNVDIIYTVELFNRRILSQS